MTLLSAAYHEGLDIYTLSYVHYTYSLRTMDFMSAGGYKIHTLPFLFYTYRDFAKGLHCIAMKPYLCPVSLIVLILHTGDFTYWHYGPSLIVYSHYRNQNRIF